ncbi:glycosyltransferase family 4 protein [Microlunatus sp. Gsoil 973]|uniref:glycosyltransferase family 4 protein n=1 Tax=Microlunatus sp. Gsoil 973 TaxID=2672569 RepID=UPI0018A84498|nr:glycosyltransferase family 4 protein [Microlunatus sp. Gsoil 973]
MTDVLPTSLQAAAPRPDWSEDRGLTVGLVCPYSLSVPGGVQNHVLGLAGYLTSIGDRVRILAPGDLDPERAGQYGVAPDQLTSAGGSLPVPYNGSIARVGFGPAVDHRVRRWLATVRPDLVHIHEPLAPGASLSSLIASRTPVVATYHTATPRSALMRLAGRVLGPVVDKINSGVAVSEPARGVVVSHLARDPAVIPNGFRADEFDHDLDHDPVAQGQWRGGDHPRLVFLGRLEEPRKGLPVLLDALPIIKRRRPDLEVVIAGSGNRARMTKIIRRRGLPVDRLLAGRIDDATRTRLLRSADLFIAPHIARESFGIVLIEAIAAGATVVASDLPAFTDLLGGTGGDPLGFVFPAGDPAGLARAVDRALDTDRTLLNARARRAVRRYDWSVVGPQIRTLYADVLRGPAAPSVPDRIADSGS